MCRHLAYVGPSTSLSALVQQPPHGLLHQSYAPRDMRGGGTVNADGFGVGWYPDGAVEPLRIRSDKPIWSDVAFAGTAAATRGTAVLAAVRSATTGMAVHAEACAPFADGRWLFSHNGVVRGWPGSVAPLAAALPVTDLLTLDAATDSALLWALVRHRLRAGEDPAAVLAGTAAAVAAAAPGSRLNLLLTDGATVWATAWTHALSVRVTEHAVLVASEPLDDLPGWDAVPDRHLVVARPGRCRTTELAVPGPPDPIPPRPRGERCAAPSSSTST